MVAVNQNDLRVRNAENLIESLSDDKSSYVFMGRSSKWEDDVAIPMVPRQRAGDQSPPYPENNYRDFIKTYDQMLSLKKIYRSDLYHMIPRIDWTSGVVYDMYRHDYTEFRRSSTNGSNLYDCLFFVITQSRDVYVCLDNGMGSQSLVEPQSTTDEPFYTSDGYQWLRLYNVTTMNMITHSTNNFIPILDKKVSSTVNGGVYTVVIESSGNDYTSYPAGAPNLVPYYYCKITGNGSGAIARVTISNNRISEIRVVNEGSGYSHAILDFVANRVYASIGDLNNNVNGLNPLGDGTFESTVIISPPGGWGYEKISSSDPNVSEEESKKSIRRLARQLGGTRVGVFSDMKSQLADFIMDTNFRQIGIIRNPQTIESEQDVETLSSHYKVKVEESQSSVNDRYFVGETVNQTKVDELDPTIKYVAKALVVGWDNENNILSYVQDASMHIDENHNELYLFSGSEPIVGLSSGKVSNPDMNFNMSNNSNTYLYGYSYPEVIKYSGEMVYLTNLPPVQRIEDQTERISMIINY